MQAPTKPAKPRKLWGSQKVFLTANELIIAEKYYPLNQTRGAYVEQVPVPVVAAKTEEPKPPASLLSTLKTIALWIFAIVAIVLALFLFWDSDSSSGSGSVKYQLVMNSTSGKVVILQNTDQKKLKEVAEAVNQALAAQGITPETASYEQAQA